MNGIATRAGDRAASADLRARVSDDDNAFGSGAAGIVDGTATTTTAKISERDSGVGEAVGSSARIGAACSLTSIVVTAAAAAAIDL